jgi:predicted helicase
MGSITILNRTGDERIDWDPADPDEVRKAAAEFERLKGEGYNFYAVEDAKGKQVKRFDPKAGKLIAAPGAQSADDKRRGARPRAMAGGPVDGAILRLGRVDR